MPTVDFAIDLSKFFTIPTFGLPELELSFYFAVGLLGVGLLRWAETTCPDIYGTKDGESRALRSGKSSISTEK